MRTPLLEHHHQGECSTASTPSRVASSSNVAWARLSELHPATGQPRGNTNRVEPGGTTRGAAGRPAHRTDRKLTNKWPIDAKGARIRSTPPPSHSQWSGRRGNEQAYRRGTVHHLPHRSPSSKQAVVQLPPGKTENTKSLKGTRSSPCPSGMAAGRVGARHAPWSDDEPLDNMPALQGKAVITQPLPRDCRVLANEPATARLR